MLSDPGYAQVRRHGFGDILREHARSRPDLPAVAEDGLALTWLQLDLRVNRLASALAQRGVGAGDRLLWLGQNAVDLFALMLASAKLGCVICPANWRMSQAEVIWAVDDFDPKVVFRMGAEWSEVHDAVEASAPGRTWCRIDGDGGDSLAAWIAAGGERDLDLDVDPDSPFLAIYTAAFSGRPSAALLSHTAMMMSSAVYCQAQAITEASRYLMCGPMFHIGALQGGFAAYLCGAPVSFTARAEASAIIEAVHRDRVTHAFLMQATAVQLGEINADGRYDLSSLFVDGDPANWRSPLMGPDHAPMVRARGNYGQTEIGGMSVSVWLGGSGAGRPNPFIQVRIMDEAGDEVPHGEVGEIAVRGALVMNGYYNRPELNAERTRTGWHRTQDLGRRQADGSLVFVGPKVRLIKSGSENIYPSEVETCLRQHPAIADACVIGVPDPKWMQSVKALVVLRDGQSLTADAVTEHCAANIASYKKPRLVEFVAGLPKSPAGGVDRDAVDRLYGGGGYPKTY